MATRQYIGARYVPKFYDFNGSPEWRSGVAYENLTIVTRNGNSYTSKKPVPSNIGEPENNPEYWAATGTYNEQVEQYRQETETVSDNLTTEITNRKNADTTLQGNINSEASTRVSADSNLQSQITTVSDNLTTEITNRKNADTTLQGNINSEASTRASADSNLQSQINQIVAPSGEAPSAAEVQNARIGADGVTYDTLGNAIRGQVTDLKSATNKHDENLSFADAFLGAGFNNFEINKLNFGTITVGSYINSSGTLTESSDSGYSDYIPVTGGSVIRLINIFIRGTRCIVAYDSNFENPVDITPTHSDDKEIIVKVPDTSAYIRATVANPITGIPCGYALPIGGGVESIGSVASRLAQRSKLISFGTLIDNYYIGATGLPYYDSGSKCTGFIPVTSGSVTLYNIYTKGSRYVIAFDSNYKLLSDITPSHNDEPFSTTLTIPSGCAFIRLTLKSDNYANSFGLYLDTITLTPSGITINEALMAGYRRIALTGGKYSQQIDMKYANGEPVTIICAEVHSQPKLYAPDCIIAESATAESGYTKVYKTAFDGNINSLWIYQDGIDDTTTEVETSDRHPIQRGKKYRCGDTRIIKCTATSLASALDEIEKSATYYKWFLDSDNDMLYFSSPEAVSENNPICYGSGANLFINASRKNTVELIGLMVKYMTINFMSMTNPKAIDCVVCNVYDYGAFRYTDAVNATFIRCEASRAQIGVNGDGFNADTDNAGEPFAKAYTSMLIECWSHDNNDDGWSEHRRSETTIIGGLFEYNQKGGITPSYGNHCSCHSVYSRKNRNGFLYTGDTQVEEGGMYGQLICYNCIAEKNIIGDDMTGFCGDADNCYLTLVGCKAIGNMYGYYNKNPNARMKLIDCGAFGNTNVRNDSGTFTIVNTTAVT